MLAQYELMGGPRIGVFRLIQYDVSNKKMHAANFFDKKDGSRIAVLIESLIEEDNKYIFSGEMISPESYFVTGWYNPDKKIGYICAK